MTITTTVKIENGIVTKSIVGDKEWAETRLGGSWIDTTGQSVGIGYTYHGDHFRPPQPFPSWIWQNEEWTAPTPYPTDGKKWYNWDEDLLSWVFVEPID